MDSEQMDQVHMYDRWTVSVCTTDGPGPSAWVAEMQGKCGLDARDRWTVSICTTDGPFLSAQQMDQVHLLFTKTHPCHIIE